MAHFWCPGSSWSRLDPTPPLFRGPQMNYQVWGRLQLAHSVLYFHFALWLTYLACVHLCEFVYWHAVIVQIQVTDLWISSHLCRGNRQHEKWNPYNQEGIFWPNHSLQILFNFIMIFNWRYWMFLWVCWSINNNHSYDNQWTPSKHFSKLSWHSVGDIGCSFEYIGR